MLDPPHFRFSRFDSDGSGSIEKDELIDILSFFGSVDESLDGDIISRIIKQVDEDGDGEINYEEFTAMMFKTAEAAVEEESAHSMKQQQHQRLSQYLDQSESQTEGSFHEDLATESAHSSFEKPIMIQQTQPYYHHRKLSFERPAVKRISGAIGTKACLALFERNIQKNEERGHDSRIDVVDFAPKRLSITKRFSHDRRRSSRPPPPPVNSTLGDNSSSYSNEPLISKNTEHSPKSTRARAALFEDMVRQQQGGGDGGKSSTRSFSPTATKKKSETISAV